MAHRLLQRPAQGVQPPAAAGRRPHHRAAQPALQGRQVHPDVFFGRLVQQVHAHHHRPGNLQNLEHQRQIPGKAGGVHHHQGDVRLAGEQVVPGHLLLGAAGMEGVGSGQVHQGVGGVPVCIGPPGGGYGFSRPVAGVLVQVCQGVEYGGFPHVGVAHQGHHRARGAVCHLPFPPCRAAVRRRYCQCMRGRGEGCGKAAGEGGPGGLSARFAYQRAQGDGKQAMKEVRRLIPPRPPFSR